MKQKKSVEDYLKTIYTLSKRKAVHGSDIAGELGVSRPTVSVALKALAEEGYVFVDGTEAGVYEKGSRFPAVCCDCGSYGWYYCADILMESRRKENYVRTERKYGAADAMYALMGACDSSGALSGAVSRP